jgi:hypothetical protein
VPVAEQDREVRRDDERVVEEIRRLFERYRETARLAAESAERKDEQTDSPAPTLR